MNTLIYILIGALDILAVIFLIFKLYRLPMWSYRLEIIVYILLSSSLSYFLRVEIEMPRIDLPIQYICMIIFMRYSLKIKMHLATFISGAGLTAYACLQLLIFYVYVLFNIAGDSVLIQTHGAPVYLIQVSSILITYLISTALYTFNLGFSFIQKPPHEFNIKEDFRLSKNKSMLFSTLLSAITTAFTVILLYSQNTLLLICMALVSFGISIFLSNRRDMDDIRIIG